MRARFVFGVVVMVALAACKKHEAAPGMAPGPSGSAATPADAVIARLGTLGGSVYPEQLVARDDGGFVLVVEVHGKVKLGDVEIAQTEEYHEPHVVVALDASGHVRWVHPMDQTCSDTVRIAVRGTQTIVAAGCERKLDAPKGDTSPPDPFDRAVVGALDDTGAIVWASQAGDDGHHTRATAVAVDADGTVFVAAQWNTAKQANVTQHDQGGFVAAYAADGKPAWTTAIANSEPQALVVGGDEVDVAGGFKRTLDLAGAKLASSGGDRFVARLAKATGEPRTAAKVGEQGSLYLALARAPSGTLYLCYDHDLDDADVLASIDATNQPKELHRYRTGPAMTLATRTLAVDATGAVWLASAFDKPLDFGSGAVTSTGAFDAVVAKYSPDGALLALTRPLPTVTEESADGLALTKAGPVVAIRSIGGPANKPYSEWLVMETYGLTSLVRIAR